MRVEVSYSVHADDIPLMNVTGDQRMARQDFFAVVVTEAV